MYYALFFIHLIIAFLLVVIVLLQRSKGGGLAGAFGGVGAGEAMFGSRGVTTFLHKATIYLAVSFMVSSLALAFLTARRSSDGGGSIARRAAQQVPVSAAPSQTEALEVPVTAEVPGATETGEDLTVPPAAAADSAAGGN